MLRECSFGEIDRIDEIINRAAVAYKGVIPADCYHEPYMPRAELEREMSRMTFYGWYEGGLAGVMGFEPVKDVSLIRHAYVLPECQREGIGSRLLRHIEGLAKGRLLVGTWAAAWWAVEFYQRHGFSLQPDKDALLRAYWDVPERQIETSVVLGKELA